MIGYVTIEQADEYVAQYLTPTSPAAIRWSSLSEDEKSVHLRVALSQIERLTLIGVKKHRNQPYQFPRHFQDDVPVEVGYAQVEQAIFRSDEDSSSEADYRLQLQQQGVSSFSIGKLSESYDSARAGSVFTPSTRSEAVLCTNSLEWLSAWIARCFSIV